uniref:Uncharacterized protein n=1 Tax=Rhizophora mucronata TaxID=61149 RepID=A0A2P2QRX3_RHIMU
MYPTKRGCWKTPYDEGSCNISLCNQFIIYIISRQYLYHH